MMKLEHLLLGVLLEAPSNGYGLKRYFDTHGRFLRSKTQMSQVYRSLAQMEENGWVRHEIDPRPGAQDSKEYRVTEEGTVVFLDWLTGAYTPPGRFEDPEFGARLSFAGFMSTEDVLRLVETELHSRLEQRARFRFRDRSQVFAPGIDFDPASGQPRGEPFRVTNFESPAQMVLPEVGVMEMALAADRIVLPILEVSGGIWILENVGR